METIIDWLPLAIQLFQVQHPEYKEEKTKKAFKKVVYRVILEIKNNFARNPCFNDDGLHFHFALTDYHNNSTRIMYKGKSIKLEQWIEENIPLFDVVYRAGKNSRNISIIKLRYKITSDSIASKSLVDIYRDFCKNQNTYSSSELNQIIYGEHYEEIQKGRFENIKVDLFSLKCFIDEQLLLLKTNDNDRIRENVNDGMLIYISAYLNHGVFRQIPTDTYSPREYFKRPNLINVHRELRHAALGSCIEYDLDNAIHRYRLYMVDEIGSAVTTVETEDYLENKKKMRLELVKLVFDNNSSLSDKEKMDLIKKAMVIITFNPKNYKNKVSWFDEKTGWHTISLWELFNDETAFNMFVNNPFIKGLVNEQKKISDAIFKDAAKNRKDLYNIPDLVKSKDKLDYNKTLAYLYHEFETKTMNIVRNHIPKEMFLVRVHDAIYTTKPLDKDTLDTIQQELQLAGGTTRLGEPTFHNYEPEKEEEPILADLTTSEYLEKNTSKSMINQSLYCM